MATKKKAAEFDKRFESGESILSELNLNEASRPGIKSQRVNVDFPAWEVEALDREADRLGVSRQSLIKIWIAERIDAIRQNPQYVASPVIRYRT